jgi:hypothetical protein
MSNSFRVVVVIAASTMASVRVTHNPCRDQVVRKRKKEGLISSKRASLPALRMRRNRKVPRRAAQIATRASNRIDRLLTFGLSSAASTVTET